METHVWTRHRETGNYWRCPVGVLDEMREKGWEPSDAPAERDLTTAEHLAWRKQATEAPAAAAETKSTKAARRGTTEE